MPLLTSVQRKGNLRWHWYSHHSANGWRINSPWSVPLLYWRLLKFTPCGRYSTATPSRATLCRHTHRRSGNSWQTLRPRGYLPRFMPRPKRAWIKAKANRLSDSAVEIERCCVAVLHGQSYMFMCGAVRFLTTVICQGDDIVRLSTET